MSTDIAPSWHAKRTEESRSVERLLRANGFPGTDAYRHNSASIRVRIIDDRFRDMSREQRDDLVEPILSQLPPALEADIINLLLMYPDEDKDSFRVFMQNSEFENGESKL